MTAECNCLALRQATRRVTQFYDQVLAPVGLRATQFSLLAQTELLGPITLQRLADAMVMDRATLGHNVRPLIARGLLQLEVGQDRRSRQLSITQAGRDLLVEANRLWNLAQEVFETAIGRDATAALRDLLDRVASEDLVLPGQKEPLRDT
jgi:DNA-binding MarR family transcriptional regulator